MAAIKKKGDNSMSPPEQRHEDVCGPNGEEAVYTVYMPDGEVYNIGPDVEPERIDVQPKDVVITIGGN